MKITIEPHDEQAAKRLIDCEAAHAALAHFLNALRTTKKHGDHPEPVADMLEAIHSDFYQCFEDLPHWLI